ncbi:MAG: transporter substrate-binding domain-containing protein [Flavobacteriaceae bacterium]|nr:MAG: transporter substrate-binding domain-containing protein [Flavobacteriaceae bacterium]
MKKITLIILIGLILFSACKNKQKKEKVTVGYLNMVSSLTHFVAIEKGYYTEQNLEVIGNPVKTSNLIAQELVAGHIDVGIELAITPALKQLEQSPNSIKVFSTSNITTENGFDAVVVKQNSSIQNLQDLAGKKIGGFPGTTAKVSFLQLFKEKFSELEQPEFIQLTPNLHIQSLKTGDIDALFAYEPVLSTGIVNHNFRTIFPSIYGTQFTPNPIGVGAVNQKWLEENPETAKAFFKAIDEAIQFIEDNPIKAKNILAKATNIDSNIAQNMNTLPLSKSNEIDLTNLDKYLTLLKELNEITIVPSASSISIKQ